MRTALFAASLAAMLGCSSDSGVKWPKLHPAKGIVKVGGVTVSGGEVHFRPEDTNIRDFNIRSEVEADGTFTLTTAHSQDGKKERKPGAPVGKYIVTYSAQQNDQTTGRTAMPVESTQPVTIAPGENNLTVDLPGKK
jgi:hypothetical protein